MEAEPITQTSQTFDWRAWLAAGKAASPRADWTADEFRAFNAGWSIGGEAAAHPGLSSPHIGPRLPVGAPKVADFPSAAVWLRAYGQWEYECRRYAEAGGTPVKATPVRRVCLEPRALHPGEIAIRWAKGGSVFQIKHGPMLGIQQIGGGERGTIAGFSRESRKRMLEKINSVNRNRINPRRVWFITLTYPKSYSPDPRVWKAHLKAWKKRLDRAWGENHCPAFWKLEPQKRGAPHFHLLVMLPESAAKGLEIVGEKYKDARRIPIWAGGKLSEFRKWCSESWFEVVNSGDAKHLLAGTQVEPMQEWSQVSAYTAKYLAKECEKQQFRDVNGEIIKNPGRFWGCWRREAWPVEWDEVKITRWQMNTVRRWVRRYIAKKGIKIGTLTGRMPGNLSVLVPAAIIERWKTEIKKTIGVIYPWEFNAALPRNGHKQKNSVVNTPFFSQWPGKSGNFRSN